MIRNSVSCFIKGVGTGMIVAAGMAVAGKLILGNNKGLQKGSTKVMRAVGDFVDGVQTMIR